MEIPQSPEKLEDHNNEEILKILEDVREWSKIPLLNYTPLHKLKDSTIVRFRGMIQDMHDPEIYLEQYEVKKSDGSGSRIQRGKYRDCLVLGCGEEVNYDSSSNIQDERRTLFVVSVPGMNDWAKNYEECCNQNILPVFTVLPNSQKGEGVKKRSASEENEMEVDHLECTNQDDKEKVDVSKRQKLEVPDKQQSDYKNQALAAEYLINSPIPERPSKACMIKIYKDFDKYSLNTVVDVVGFLSVDPSLDGGNMEVDNFESRAEMQALNPPPSLIPRLHAIAVRNLSHFNPLIDMSLSTNEKGIEDFNMQSVQKDLHMLLTLCLFNDDLAADYLLSHLISTVYSRCELQSIGKFSLNICNIPKEALSGYTKQLYEILELIIPASHYLPMALDTLNASSFAPK